MLGRQVIFFEFMMMSFDNFMLNLRNMVPQGHNAIIEFFDGIIHFDNIFFPNQIILATDNLIDLE
jgi:hypothetical protein